MLQVGCGLSPCALSAVTRQPAAAKPKTILFMLSSRCRDAALVGPVFGLAGVPSAEPDIAPSVQRRHSRSKQVDASTSSSLQTVALPPPLAGEGAEAIPQTLRPWPRSSLSKFVGGRRSACHPRH